MVINKKIIEEIKKSNKELDKFLDKINIDVDEVLKISHKVNKEELIDQTLLVNSIVDLRSEVSNLKRRLVTDIEVSINKTITELFTNFQKNILNQVEINNSGVKRLVLDNINDMQNEVSKLRVEFTKHISEMNKKIENLEVLVNEEESRLKNFEETLKFIEDNIKKETTEIKDYRIEFKKDTEDIINDIKTYSSEFEKNSENVALLVDSLKRIKENLNHLTVSNLFKKLDKLENKVESVEFLDERLSKLENSLNSLSTNEIIKLENIEDELKDELSFEDRIINKKNSKKEYKNRIIDIDSKLKVLSSLVDED